MAQLATLVNVGDVNYNDKFYKLANNINLSAYGSNFNDGKGWIPIGKYDPVNVANNFPFKGVFDGDNNRITGLYINDPDLFSGAGLFGSIVERGIYNLIVDSVNIRAAGYVGSVAGHISIGGLWQCGSSGNIVGWQHVGGLVGHLELNAFTLNCYSLCNVSGLNAASDFIGGIAGWAENICKITNCYSTGNVSGRDFIGGIVGCLSLASIVSNSYSTGNVTGNDNVGGIAGCVPGAFLINCYSTGSVSGNDFVGGIAGNVTNTLACLKGAIIDCAALNPSVEGENYVGRVIGRNITQDTINNVAYDGLLTKAGDINWNNKERDQIDGEDITKETINADRTLGGRFIDTVWTTQKGKLPGLFKQTVDMPQHLLMGNAIVTKIRDNSNIRIYPNPTNGQLKIESGKLKIEKVEIFDIVGKKIQSKTVNPQSEIVVDVSGLPSGTYFITIYGEGQKITKKFVKE